METLPKKAIIETIECCEEYITRLDSLLNEATDAEGQVTASAQCATQNISDVFDELHKAFTLSLDRRKLALIESVKAFEKEALTPLADCKNEIMAKRDVSSSLIEDAKKVLKMGGFQSKESYSEFRSKSATLGALPDVPDLEFVPHITFQGNPSFVISDFTSAIVSFGNVFKIGPVQISTIEPHPGALMVRWEEVDYDIFSEIQSYRLQIANFEAFTSYGDDEGIFQTIYIGKEPAYLARDLQLHNKYVFRVCCRTSEKSDWSPWSRIKTASTEVAPFTWDSDNGHYLISNGCKMARMISPCSILFSSVPHISTGQSIRFTLFNLSNCQPIEGVALCASNSLPVHSLAQRGTFFVSFLGDVFIDGQRKLMNLPIIDSPCEILFGCELVKGKWRITIETGLKVATYDWVSGTEHLSFATLLCQPETQVLVD